jgi:hypothetical protein
MLENDNIYFTATKRRPFVDVKPKIAEIISAAGTQLGLK